MSDWIEWNDGEQPVPDGTLVQCLLREPGGWHGETYPAEEWVWLHDAHRSDPFGEGEADIIAYRVVEQ